MHPPDGPRHTRGSGRHSSPDPPRDDDRASPRYREPAPAETPRRPRPGADTAAPPDQGTPDHGDAAAAARSGGPPHPLDDPPAAAPGFDPEVTVVLRGEDVRRWRRPAPAGSADAAGDPDQGAAAASPVPGADDSAQRDPAAGPDPADDDLASVDLASVDLAGGPVPGGPVPGTGDPAKSSTAGGPAHRTGDPGWDDPAGGRVPGSAGWSRSRTPGGWVADVGERQPAGRAAALARLRPVWAAVARLAGTVARRPAGVGRRGVQALAELDERVRRDPARRERSAMLVVGGGAVVVALGIGILLVLAGTGDSQPAPAGGGAAGTRPSGSPLPTAGPSVTASAPATTAQPSPTLPAGAALRAVQSGKCLAVPGDTTEAGAQLVQLGCDADPGKRFLLVPVAGRVRTFSLVNALTSRCVDVSGAGGDDGTPVIQWECNGQPNQQFELRDVPAFPGYVQLVAQHSGKCVDADQVSTADSAPVQQWTCRITPVVEPLRSQSWQLVG